MWESYIDNYLDQFDKEDYMEAMEEQLSKKDQIKEALTYNYDEEEDDELPF